MNEKWGVVIGAGPGLGRSLALVMARAGLNVAVIGRNEDSTTALVDEIRTSQDQASATASATALTMDASDPDGVLRTMRDFTGRVELDAVVYNVAATGGPLLGTDLAVLQSSLLVNMVSAVATAQAVAENLQRNHGALLLTGGGFALYPSSEAGVLSVGKAALRTTALVLAQELQPRGVTVRTLTIAGILGSSPSFAPDVVADAFWNTRTGDDVEVVYSG